MKFKNKIEVCRHDEVTPFISIQKGLDLGTKCTAYREGFCLHDNKKCKIVTYERMNK